VVDEIATLLRETVGDDVVCVELFDEEMVLLLR
jgi:hypothetical protein